MDLSPDFETWNVKDMRNHLRSNRMSTTGNRQTLLQRLNALQSESVEHSSTDVTMEDHGQSYVNTAVETVPNPADAAATLLPQGSSLKNIEDRITALSGTITQFENMLSAKEKETSKEGDEANKGVLKKQKAAIAVQLDNQKARLENLKQEKAKLSAAANAAANVAGAVSGAATAAAVKVALGTPGSSQKSSDPSTNPPPSSSPQGGAAAAVKVALGTPGSSQKSSDPSTNPPPSSSPQGGAAAATSAATFEYPEKFLVKFYGMKYDAGQKKINFTCLLTAIDPTTAILGDKTYTIKMKVKDEKGNETEFDFKVKSTKKNYKVAFAMISEESIATLAGTNVIVDRIDILNSEDTVLEEEVQILKSLTDESFPGVAYWWAKSGENDDWVNIENKICEFRETNVVAESLNHSSFDEENYFLKRFDSDIGKKTSVVGDYLYFADKVEMFSLFATNQKKRDTQLDLSKFWSNIDKNFSSIIRTALLFFEKAEGLFSQIYKTFPKKFQNIDIDKFQRSKLTEKGFENNEELPNDSAITEACDNVFGPIKDLIAFLWKKFQNTKEGSNLNTLAIDCMKELREKIFGDFKLNEGVNKNFISTRSFLSRLNQKNKLQNQADFYTAKGGELGFNGESYNEGAFSWENNTIKEGNQVTELNVNNLYLVPKNVSLQFFDGKFGILHVDRFLKFAIDETKNQTFRKQLFDCANKFVNQPAVQTPTPDARLKAFEDGNNGADKQDLKNVFDKIIANQEHFSQELQGADLDNVDVWKQLDYNVLKTKVEQYKGPESATAPTSGATVPTDVSLGLLNSSIGSRNLEVSCELFNQVESVAYLLTKTETLPNQDRTTYENQVKQQIQKYKKTIDTAYQFQGGDYSSVTPGPKDDDVIRNTSDFSTFKSYFEVLSCTRFGSASHFLFSRLIDNSEIIQTEDILEVQYYLLFSKIFEAVSHKGTTTNIRIEDDFEGIKTLLNKKVSKQPYGTFSDAEWFFDVSCDFGIKNGLSKLVADLLIDELMRSPDQTKAVVNFFQETKKTFEAVAAILNDVKNTETDEPKRMQKIVAKSYFKDNFEQIDVILTELEKKQVNYTLVYYCLMAVFETVFAAQTATFFGLDISGKIYKSFSNFLTLLPILRNVQAFNFNQTAKGGLIADNFLSEHQQMLDDLKASSGTKEHFQAIQDANFIISGIPLPGDGGASVLPTVAPGSGGGGLTVPVTGGGGARPPPPSSTLPTVTPVTGGGGARPPPPPPSSSTTLGGGPPPPPSSSTLPTVTPVTGGGGARPPPPPPSSSTTTGGGGLGGGPPPPPSSSTVASPPSGGPPAATSVGKCCNGGNNLVIETNAVWMERNIPYSDQQKTKVLGIGGTRVEHKVDCMPVVYESRSQPLVFGGVVAPIGYSADNGVEQVIVGGIANVCLDGVSDIRSLDVGSKLQLNGSNRIGYVVDFPDGRDSNWCRVLLCPSY